MKTLEKHTINLDEYKVSIFNISYIDPTIPGKKIEDYLEEDNKFGWNVSYAEITIEKQNNLLIEYKLFSKDGIEQSHALKIESSEIVYWRFEFIGRKLNYSPDFFEPSLEIFLTFYYQDIYKNDKLLSEELSLPVAFYEISVDNELKSIRYALSVDNLYTKPLFLISINNDGYLKSISDWQSIDNKNIFFPTPDYPSKYLLHKFSENQNSNLHKLENADTVETKVLVFKGFKEYEVKYYADFTKEPEFANYGFFVNEIREIVTETHLLLKFIPTINYHLIKPCNMVCKHCFSDFNELNIKQLDLNVAKKIVDEISQIKSFRKLNFSGGEPTLFNGIEVLIGYAKDKGLETSMVTNGFKLINDPKLFDSFKNKLDLLVFSIDSLDKELNLKIGRHVGKKTISIDEFVMLSEECHKSNVQIKINTVVTKLNFDQVLVEKIALLKPIRWKIFKMLPIEFQNDKANNIYPSNEEFETFLINNRIKAEKLNIKVVIENNNEMTGSYLMISPDGKFFNNIEGSHNYSDSIIEVGIKKALQQTPLLREVFYKREGEYSCN
jgi:radical S-adenosyl methionine domain-containing protein 2